MKSLSAQMKTVYEIMKMILFWDSKEFPKHLKIVY